MLVGAYGLGVVLAGLLIADSCAARLTSRSATP
jgi:hypothetical protein